MWGSRSPYLTDKNLWAEFWAMETGFAYIMFKILPNLLARKSVRAQRKVIAAFTKYHEARYDSDDDVATFIRGRCLRLGRVRLDIGAEKMLTEFVRGMFIFLRHLCLPMRHGAMAHSGLPR